MGMRERNVYFKGVVVGNTTAETIGAAAWSALNRKVNKPPLGSGQEGAVVLPHISCQKQRQYFSR